MINRLRTRFAMNALALGNYEKAEILFRKIAATENERPGLKHNIGLALMAQGHFREALPFFLREAEIYGDSWSRCLALGDLNFQLNQRTDAFDWYKKAVRDAPSEEDEKRIQTMIRNCKDDVSFQNVHKSRSLFMESRERLQAGDADKALELLHEAVALDETHFESWNEAGTIYLNIKNCPEKALPCFEKAREYSPLSVIKKNEEMARKKIVSKV